MNTGRAVKLIDQTLLVLIFLLWILSPLMLLSQMFHDETIRLLNGNQDDWSINQTEFFCNNTE